MSYRRTDHRQRVNIVERHHQGETLQAIADTMDLNYYTVRKWWRKYRSAGWAGLVPQSPGPSPSGPLSRFDPLVKYVALRLKREHPAWGLDLLLLTMSRRPSLKGKKLPSRSVVGAYLQGFAPRLKEHRPLWIKRPEPERAETPKAAHEGWQMDFKGEEKIPGLGKVKPFIVCDKFTTAPLAGIIHALNQTGKKNVSLSFRDVQHNLRTVFRAWGLPDYIQMDRDPLWVGSARLEWPGTILLWLVGLDIKPVINRPYRPTDNAQVERCNRTWDEHVRIGAKDLSLDQLQLNTDQAWQDRRHYLPSRNPNCNGLPPLVAQPGLAQPRRCYSTADEPDLFAMDRVYTYLSRWQWERKVDTQGCISMAHINRRVGDKYIGQIVKVHFDRGDHNFVARSVDGTTLRRFTLPVISSDYILGLEPRGGP